MSLTRLVIPAHAQMLRAALGWLDKAAAQRPGAAAEALLAARLAPDMFPLASQICFVALQAREPAFRLRGETLPEALEALMEEGRDPGRLPTSLARSRGQLQAALAALEALPPEALDEGAGRRVTLALPSGLTFDMTGEEYVRDWALPQFHFHLVTAYAILRHQGIELGKADYVPHMFAYLRPGPAAPA